MDVSFHELTHHGRGAIAVVGVRGNDAGTCIGKCFSPASGKSLAKLTDQSIVYGIWNSTNEDLIVVRIDDCQFEVQCHGGVAAVESVKSDLADQGAVQSSHPHDWRKDNLLQADIAAALESCLTRRTATHLLQQYEHWGSPERFDITSMQAALAFAEFGKHLTTPWTVVLCGRPNVGKSSLINALVGFDRAIVHATAGTTRDLVSQQTAIDGWPVELTDSAGIRDASNEIEVAGIGKARQLIECADLVIQIVDASDPQEFDPAISHHRAGIVVVNKIDLCASPTAPHVDCPTAFVSATTGQGIEQLQQLVSEVLVPAIPNKDQIVPVTQSHLQFLLSRTRSG